MDYKKLLREFLKTSHKLSDTEIDSLINESDEAATQSALTELDQKRVSKLVEPIAGKQEQFEKAGFKKAMDKLEKSLKAKYDIDLDLQGEELVDAIVLAKSEASKKAKDLTDDDVKRHPVYRDLEKAKKQQLTDKETELNNKIADLQKGYQKKETFSTVGKKALSILDSLNPVLPTKPEVAATLKNKFLNEFESFDYQVDQNGILVLDKDGKVVDDGHGNNLSFETMVKEKASSWFDFQQNNGGSNGGNGNAGKNDQGAGGNTGGNKKNFKTFDEVSAYLRDPNTTPEQGSEAVAAWESAQKTGTTI